MNYRSYSKKRTGLCVELLLLMLVSARFFDLLPLAPLLAGGGNVFLLLGTLALIYMTQLGFQLRTGIVKKMKPVWWILGGLFLSYFAAYFYYGQSFFQSFIVNRQFFSLLVFPLLLAVRPTYREMKWSLNAFTIICAIVTLYVSFVDPTLVPLAENVQFIEDGEFVHTLSGLHFVVIAFIFSLHDYRNKRTNRRLVPVLLIFLFIFIAQNRTFLISTALIVILSVFSNRSQRSRLYAFGVMAVAAIIIVVALFNYFYALFNETLEQLSNPEYNRIKALIYVFSLPNGKASILIGNGFISGSVSSLVADLNKEGIYYSDIGLVGLWHVYGLLPVLTVLTNVSRGLSVNHSLEVRANALLILVCSLTIGYFATIETLTWLSFYLYFLFSDKEYAEAVSRRRAQIQKEILRRYRSLN